MARERIAQGSLAQGTWELDKLTGDDLVTTIVAHVGPAQATLSEVRRKGCELGKVSIRAAGRIQLNMSVMIAGDSQGVVIPVPPGDGVSVVKFITLCFDELGPWLEKHVVPIVPAQGEVLVNKGICDLCGEPFVVMDPIIIFTRLAIEQTWRAVSQAHGFCILKPETRTSFHYNGSAFWGEFAERDVAGCSATKAFKRLARAWAAIPPTGIGERAWRLRVRRDREVVAAWCRKIGSKVPAL